MKTQINKSNFNVLSAGKTDILLKDYYQTQTANIKNLLMEQKTTAKNTKSRLKDSRLLAAVK